MIAGGASLAPRRWSWPAFATEARSRPWCLSTAWITAAQKNRNCRLSCGVSPGSSRLWPVSVPIDQLLCLPEPLTPAKGFSCSRQTRPYLRATFCITCIMSCWWSEPTFEFSKIGAISYCAGRHLVVARLDRHAELGQLELDLDHAREHALGDRAEVVVVELVALRRLGAEQRAPGVDQVGPLEVVLLVDQEVLLLGADGGEHPRGLVVAEQPQRPDRRARQRVHRAQQRDLVVERLAGPGRERRRDAQQRPVRVLEDEGRAGRDPRPCSRAPRRSRARRRSGTRTRRARPGSAPCPRTPPARCRRRSGPKNESCFSAVRPGERLEHVREVGGAAARAPTPSSPSATASASEGSSGSPFSSVRCRRL